MSPPLALSDSELETIMRLAAPIDQNRRDDFLREVAAELTRHPERGDGLTFRVGREIQRRFLNPPALQHTKGYTSKYRR